MRWVANSCRACWCRAWQQAAGSGRLSQSSESGTPEPTARPKFRLASAAVRAAPAIASDSPWPRLAAVPGRARRRRARLHAGRSDSAQGESIPPGRRAPPRPSRNHSEEPSRPTSPKPRQRDPGPPHTSTRNKAERLVQLSPPRRDPDDRPLPARRAQRRGLLLEVRDRRRIDASIV
jgi:hypothetical protein